MIVARARLYHTVRSAHLERALELDPADLIYGQTRYDFDEALATSVAERAGLEQASDWRLARILLSRAYDAVEINEPIALETVRRTALALTAVRVSDVLRRHRTAVVAYAIGNVRIRDLPRPGGKARLGRMLDEALAPRVWRRCDRVVFGTDTARDAYRSSFGPPGRRTSTMTVPALPTACSCRADDETDGRRLLFLGDLSARKGFDAVAAAWPRVRADLPDARLAIVGRGALLEQARSLADGDDRVELFIDPPRVVVHEQLRRAAVVVLPSQPAPGWREQVGLPLVEGLAHGCTVVTTEETGIATWLKRHGHHTVPAHLVSTLLAAEIVSALRHPQDPQAVIRTLPARDGRLEADARMFAP